MAIAIGYCQKNISYSVVICNLDEQVQLQFRGTNDVKENDAIFNYRRKYLPTQQVSSSMSVLHIHITQDILHMLADLKNNAASDFFSASVSSR